MQHRLISVIIPTMNEEKAIGETIDSLHSALKKDNYEIIIIDTNSTDSTVKIAKQKGARVINEPRRGYGRAYMTGFSHAKGDIIATLDADATYPVEKIIDFVNILEKENLDFISGLRKGALSLKHRLGNKLITITENVLFLVHLVDSQSGMWIFRSSILPSLNLKNESWPFSGEIKIEAWKKFRCREIPIKYSIRKGESKLHSWKVGTENIKFAFKKRFSR